MKTFLLFSLIFFSHHAWSQECLDKDRVQNEVLNQFNVTVSQMDLCDQRSPSYRLFQAIFFLKDLGEVSYKKSQFIRGIIGNNPYEFFKKRVHKISIESQKDGCEGVANVHPAENREILHICPMAAMYSPMQLSSILIHEARHVDGPEFSHHMCMEGPNKGNFSCDNFYEDGASYAANTEYLLILSKATKLPLEVRKQARAMAIRELVSRFNVKPGDLETGALLIDEKGEATFYNGSAQKKIDISIPKNSIPILRGNILHYFLKDTGEVLSYLFDEHLQTAPQDILTQRFQQMKHQDNNQIVKDVVYSNQYVCLLFITAIECAGKDFLFFKKEFSHFKAQKFVYKKNKSSFMEAGRVHILSENNESFLLPLNDQALKSSNPLSWPHSKTGLFDIGDLGYRRPEVILDNQGRLYLFQRRGRQQTNPLPEQNFQRMLAPFVWSEELKNL